jgi:hypothetical protein
MSSGRHHCTYSCAERKVHGSATPPGATEAGVAESEVTPPEGTEEGKTEAGLAE